MDVADVARKFATLTENRPGLFDEMAAAVFAFQRSQNDVYRRYCDALNGAAGEMPFLPVEVFKHGPVTCFPPEEAEQVFESSGTGRSVPSRHYIKSLALYERAVSTHFERVFGPGPFVLAAYLPEYTRRGNKSSLLYMVRHLMMRFGASPLPDRGFWISPPGLHSRASGSGASSQSSGAFFASDRAPLDAAIDRSRSDGFPLILIGAAFGLLGLIEQAPIELPADALVIETGGMKTYRREISRSELHERLAAGFRISRTRIWSEYGMCELMSQCYTRGGDVFYPPPWMQCSVRDADDPTREAVAGEPGVLAVFDLANVYSASPILTQDRAVQRENGFEVLGRLEGAELRGCNFLLEHV